MVAACSSPDLMVLPDMLVVNLPGHKQGLEWLSVECSSKAAYGCGEHGEGLIQGLSLSLRRLDRLDLNSSLSINLNSAALQSIQLELGVTDQIMRSGNPVPNVVATIQSAAARVLVVFVVFRLYQNLERRAYYLVYDATDASLYMIPCLPEHSLGARYTMAPVPARAAGAGGHELALTARAYFSIRDCGRLCVCTPATRESPCPGKNGPWAVKMQRLPKLPHALSADLTFSLDGNVFWADLTQGVAYSNLRHQSRSDVVFVELPDVWMPG
nr:unnamed protein product [Digitaria exilis]